MDDEAVVQYYDGGNNDATFGSGASTLSLSSEEQRTKMIQQIIQEPLDELERVMEAHEIIGEDVDRLANELQELSESEDEPLFSRYIGVAETSHLVRLARRVNNALLQFKEGLAFVQRCVNLRQNDPETTLAITRNYVPVHYDPPFLFGSIIADCLQHNTHVTTICIQIESLVGPNDDNRTKKANVDALLHYLKNSSVLRRVELSHWSDYPNDEDHVVMLLNAIGQSQHITELSCTLCFRAIPSVALCELLSKSKSITTFLVCCGIEWEQFTYIAAQSVAPHPWCMTQSLVNLSLYRIDTKLIQALSFLEWSHAHLEKLTFDDTGNARDLSVLSPFLKRSTMLQHLEFKRFELGTHDVDCIFDGLQHHYAMNLTTYVTKLSFLDCSFVNDDSARRFLEHFQTPTSDLKDAAQLKELKISLRDSEVIGLPVGSFIASLVTMHAGSNDSPQHIQQHQAESQTHGYRKGYYKTIGSQLKVLSLPSYRTGFCETMLSNVDAVTLSCLHLSWWGEEQTSKVCTALPNLLSLQELHIRTGYGSYDDRIVKMIERCGSLRVVTVRDGKSSVLNDTHTQLIESFCQRNIVLHKIRSGEVQWGDKNCSSLIDECDILHQHKKCKTDIRDTIPVAVLPAILQAAKQVPLTCASMTISSLLLFRHECE